MEKHAAFFFSFVGYTVWSQEPFVDDSRLDEWKLLWALSATSAIWLVASDDDFTQIVKTHKNLPERRKEQYIRRR